MTKQQLMMINDYFKLLDEIDKELDELQIIINHLTLPQFYEY